MIVPVYNVEEYLARCLDSILAQTYKNLEVIVINDGSTDSSGRICDDYAQKDSRVRVIHQENQGLAEVRNIGVRECRGEWIQFVDSDDWIDPETIETCCRYANEYDAEIVTFRCVLEYENGKRHHTVKKHYPPELMTSKKAVSVILLPDSIVDVIFCDKLIKAELFEGIVYPKGKLYEDMLTIHKVLVKTDRILCISSEFYHYLRRRGSIGHYRFSQKTYGIAEAAQKVFDFALSMNLGDKAAFRNLAVGLWHWRMHVANDMIKSEVYDNEYISGVQKAIKAHVVIQCPSISLSKKAQMLLFKYSFRLYSLLYLRFRRDKS